MRGKPELFHYPDSTGHQFRLLRSLGASQIPLWKNAGHPQTFNPQQLAGRERFLYPHDQDQHGNTPQVLLAHRP